MTHPQESAHAIDALGLEDRTVGLVTHDLPKRHPVFYIRRAAIPLVQEREECLATLRPFEGEVMQPVVEAQRPESLLRHHEPHAFHRRNGGGADLRVKFSIGVLKVLRGGQGPVRTMAAYRAISGAADVGDIRVQLGELRTEARVKDLRRIPLVASAIDANGGMTADAREEVARVG